MTFHEYLFFDVLDLGFCTFLLFYIALRGLVPGKPFLFPLRFFVVLPLLLTFIVRYIPRQLFLNSTSLGENLFSLFKFSGAKIIFCVLLGIGFFVSVLDLFRFLRW